MSKEGSILKAEHVWYFIKNKKTKQDKIILRDVSVKALGGEVMAIMGPSGAGKTMFLNALTLQRGPGRRYGMVELNGQRFSNQIFKRYCAIVTQQELQWPFLTCRQALHIAYDLFAREDRQLKDSFLDDLCGKLGLGDCQDTRVGNVFIPGLSFGQRRRLSIATVLLKGPLVVFLDEPTTNLDSASASGIMNHLKALAIDLNLIIVCTIHQPDRHTFNGFDQLLLLSEGQVAYCGPAAAALAHFASLGMDMPTGENPADFMLDLMNKSFTDPNLVDSLLQEWASSAKPGRSSVSAQAALPSTTFEQSVCVQIYVLFRRHCLLFARDPFMYVGRAIMMMFSTCFFALVYVKAREAEQAQALNRAWLMLWTVGVPANLGVVAAFAINLEFITVRFEVFSGMYKLVSYIIAHTLVQLPVMVLFSVCAISLSGFVIGAWYGPAYFMLVLIYSALLLNFECFAQLVGIIESHPILAMLDFMNYWFASFLFCGLLLPEEDVIWPFRVLTYVAPMKYTITAAVYLNYESITWEGAILDISSPTGFSCPGLALTALGRGCWGATGKQVLTSLHQNFPPIKPDANVGECVLIILVVSAAFKVLSVIVAYWKCRSVSPPAPLPEGETQHLELPREKTMETVVKVPGSDSGSSKVFAKKRDLSAQPRLVLTMEHGFYSITKRKGCSSIMRDLLTDVSLSVCSGELLAVMGPSGSGKSLLLNLLSLVPGSGTRNGRVSLNSNPFSAKLFSKYCAQILQMDLHWPFLTPREQLQMAADLYKQVSHVDKSAEIDSILQQLGLEGCQHTRIGNQFIPGCSGGQRRRVSIAVAMIKSPLLLFLDEPTSGLDSAAARNIILTLNNLAVTKDIIISITLSQPSASIFALIDQLVLLSAGRVAYSGAARDVVQYFGTIGYHLPDGENPAEFALGLLNPGFTEQETVDAVLQAWQGKDESVIKRFKSIENLDLPPVFLRPGFCARALHLLKRQALFVVRDPTMYLGRIFFNLFACIFFGIMYVYSRDATQLQVRQRTFLVMWILGVPTNFILVAVYAHQTEIGQVLMETKSGMYDVAGYILAQTVLQIPVLAICSLCAFGIGGYVVGNWDPAHFMLFWLLHMLTYWVFETQAQALAARSMNVLLNMMDFANLWFSAFLFCGMLLDVEFVVWPFRALTYILPFRYGVRSLMWCAIEPSTYSGAFLNNSTRGFDCDPGVHSALCYGFTGCQVLDSLTAVFPNMSCQSTAGMDILFLLIMVAAWKLIFIVTLVPRTLGLKTLKLRGMKAATVVPF